MRQKSGIKNASQGFTLIELLVVIAIIGILSSVLLANYVGVRQRSRDGVRKSDLRQIQAALELWRADAGEYPSLPACGSSLTAGGVIYMKKIPCDPSPTSVYFYVGSNATATGYNTYSLTACLENANDSQKDSPTNALCAATTNTSYTLKNP